MTCPPVGELSSWPNLSTASGWVYTAIPTLSTGGAGGRLDSKTGSWKRKPHTLQGQQLPMPLPAAFILISRNGHQVRHLEAEAEPLGTENQGELYS